MAAITATDSASTAVQHILNGVVENGKQHHDDKDGDDTPIVALSKAADKTLLPKPTAAAKSKKPAAEVEEDSTDNDDDDEEDDKEESDKEDDKPEPDPEVKATGKGKGGRKRAADGAEKPKKATAAAAAAVADKKDKKDKKEEKKSKKKKDMTEEEKKKVAKAKADDQERKDKKRETDVINAQKAFGDNWVKIVAYFDKLPTNKAVVPLIIAEKSPSGVYVYWTPQIRLCVILKDALGKYNKLIPGFDQKTTLGDILKNFTSLNNTEHIAFLFKGVLAGAKAAPQWCVDLELAAQYMRSGNSKPIKAGATAPVPVGVDADPAFVYTLLSAKHLQQTKEQVKAAVAILQKKEEEAKEEIRAKAKARAEAEAEEKKKKKAAEPKKEITKQKIEDLIKAFTCPFCKEDFEEDAEATKAHVDGCTKKDLYKIVEGSAKKRQKTSHPTPSASSSETTSPAAEESTTPTVESPPASTKSTTSTTSSANMDVVD